MGEYVGNKKEMRFKSIDSLRNVERVIEEADKALKDKSRKISDSPIGETLSGALGIGAGGAIGFAQLYFGGKVVGLSAAGISSGLAAAGSLIGGGMAAGIAVVAAPAVILGTTGVGVATAIKYKKLKSAKELTYKNALAKQSAIIKELQKNHHADKKRIDYLNSINTLLTSAIIDLRHDLGISA